MTTKDRVEEEIARYRSAHWRRRAIASIVAGTVLGGCVGYWIAHVMVVGGWR